MVFVEVGVMARKTFLEENGMKLTGDDRDVMVPKRYYRDVLAWCADQGIIAEGAFDHDYNARMSAFWFDVNLWRIKNEKHRMLFILRWS